MTCFCIDGSKLWLLTEKMNQIACYLDALALKNWCRGAESNHRHEDFQSSALPTELPRQKPKILWLMATWMGLEPTTSSVTG